MRMPTFRGVSYVFGVFLVALLALHACGGGGGESGAAESGGDAGGELPSGGLSGKLWHDNFALDSLDGAQIAFPSGAAPVRLTDKLAAYPWPDGTQYVTTDTTATRGRTQVTAFETSTGQALYQVSFEGYVRQVRPSPVSKKVILATWGEDSVAPAMHVFYDLAAHVILDQIDAGGLAVNWLPDGRYVSVAADGRIRIGTVGGSSSPAGTVAVPGGGEVTYVWPSPDGSRLLLQIVRTGVSALDETDLWLANLDGSATDRFTNTHITSYGYWSPDGKYIAFDADTGSTCGGGGCMGSCQLFYAEATSRGVTALPSAGDAAKFHVRDRRGADSLLGCDLLAWTP